MKIFGPVLRAVFLLAFTASACGADTLYLKNGKVYEGRVKGKSLRRYVFIIDAAGEKIPLSFFIDEVDKVEMGKDSAEAQIPFLKEIETFQVPVGQDKTKVYESSVYKDEKLTVQESIVDPLIRQKLTPEEFEYYQRFKEIGKSYTDQLVAIENIYLDLTSATKEEFAIAKKDMDEFYFELNNLVVPEAFKAPHKMYLQSVKATFLVFNALEQGMLDEASRQMKLAEETKEKAMAAFRTILTERPVLAASAQAPAEGAPKEAATTPGPSEKKSAQAASPAHEPAPAGKTS